MIYRLNDAFTKIEETEGIMQNLNRHAEIEVVSCVDDPKKDSGLLLMPMEKLKFCTKEEESIYVRCAEIDGTNANLSVVNFNMPVSGGTGAGGSLHETMLFSGYVIPSTTNVCSVLTLSDDMTNYDFLAFKATYGNHNYESIVYVPLFDSVTSHKELKGSSSFCNIIKLSNTTIGQNYWNVVGWKSSNDGIYSIVGLKFK